MTVSPPVSGSSATFPQIQDRVARREVAVPPGEVSAPPDVRDVGGRAGGLARRALLDSAYLLASWPILMAAFSVVISLLASSVGLAIVWVGIPLFLVTFGAARVFVLAECWLERTLLGAAPAPGPYRPRRQGESL